jgi:hypothetical protein
MPRAFSGLAGLLHAGSLDSIAMGSPARRVAIGARAALAGYGTVLTLGLITGSRPPLEAWGEAAAIVVLVLALWMVGRGRPTVAGILVLAAVWAETHWEVGLVPDPGAISSVAVLPVMVLGAGVMLGGQAALAVALGLSMTFPGALALSGWLGRGPGLDRHDLDVVVVTAVSLCVTGTLVLLAMGRFGEVLARARDSESRLHEAFRHAPDGILVLDVHGRVAAANASTERILGRPAACLLGRSLESLGFPPVSRADEEYGPVDEVRYERPDGSRVLLEVTSRRAPADGGERLHMMIRDLTRRRSTEELAAQLGHIVEGAQNEIYIFHAETLKLLLVNRGARTNLGFSLSELIDSPVWLVNPGLAEARARLLGTRLAARTSGALSVHGVHLRRDGSTYPVDLQLQAGRLDGEPVVVVFAVDATRRLRSEAEQRQLQSQLQHAQKMEAVGLLAGGVAHDFNNLLMVISAGVEVLVDELSDDPDGVIDEMRRASHRGTALTRQLLTFARREAVQPRLVDLRDVALGMEPLLHRLVGARIALAIRTAAPAPVVADAGQLEQVLLNLVANARDAVEDGGEIRIEVAAIDDGKVALLAVEDDGSGIDPAIQHRVFEPFFTTKAEGAGTGLGLSTVHGIVLQGGGRIELDSAPGRGTRVEIRWPSAAGEGGVAGEEHAASPPEASRATVLVAEDNDATRRAVRLLLERNGYRVFAADCGESALHLARQLGGEIDVLLTDLVMPDMSGAELVRALRPELPHLPAVLMSGYTDHRLRDHVDVPGVDQVLLKPFTGAEVTEHLERALARAGGPWLMADAS